MHSSLIGKIEKAHRYAQEPERVRINGLSATFHGSHDEYDVTLADGHWTCNCHTFDAIHTCSHVMALQQLIGQMLTPDLRYDVEEHAATM